MKENCELPYMVWGTVPDYIRLGVFLPHNLVVGDSIFVNPILPLSCGGSIRN